MAQAAQMTATATSSRNSVAFQDRAFQKCAIDGSLLAAPSGALKTAPGRYPSYPIPSNPTYSFECSISFNYDKKKDTDIKTDTKTDTKTQKT